MAKGPVSAMTPATPDLERIAGRLKPLGSPVRLRLLRFLTRPHYLEEIASELRMNRYAAKRHVDELAKTGLIRVVPGQRDSGPVRDYLVAPEALFEAYDAVRTLGELRPAPDVYAQTLPGLIAQTKASGAPRGPRSADGGGARLVLVYGAEIGRVFGLAPRPASSPQWIVGRDPKADVLIDADPFVSHRHARLSRQGTDLVVTDAYSTNGTWINWERLAAGESAPLAAGDILGIGRTLLVFRR